MISRLQSQSLPIRASANGNTFLIFDCIQNKFNYLHMLFWFITKKVDSCLVLYHNNSYNDHLNDRMDVYLCQISGDNIYVKTWERGIQRFTKSCGTGVVSCVETARITGRIKSKSKYEVRCANEILEILIVCMSEDRKKCLLYGETTLDR